MLRRSTADWSDGWWKEKLVLTRHNEYNLGSVCMQGGVKEKKIFWKLEENPILGIRRICPVESRVSKRS